MGNKPKVVVVGAGFGGIAAVKNWPNRILISLLLKELTIICSSHCCIRFPHLYCLQMIFLIQSVLCSAIMIM